MMRCPRIRRMAFTLSAAVFAAAMPFSAKADYAVYPDKSETPASVGSYVSGSRGVSALSEEEWAALEDDTLLYDEIADLIHEYSPTVVINRDELSKDERRSMDAAEVSEYLLDKADDYDEQADAVSDTSATLAATYRAQANSLRSEAASNLDDFEIIKLTYEEIEHSLALSARKAFVQYRLYEEKLAFQDYYIEYLGTLLLSLRIRQSVGMATELDVLSAEEALLSAEAERISIASSRDNTLMGLIVSCGWHFDASPVIGELPAVDIEALHTTDFDADQAAARESNITLKIDNIRLSNAVSIGTASDVASAGESLKSDEDSFVIGFKAAYDQLMLALNDYELSLRTADDGAASFDTLSRQYAEGLISLSELREGEYSLKALTLASDEAYVSLIEALAVYEAALYDGVL